MLWPTSPDDSVAMIENDKEIHLQRPDVDSEVQVFPLADQRSCTAGCVLVEKVELVHHSRRKGQTKSGFKTAEQVISRRVLRDSWNNALVSGAYKGQKASTGSFRLVNNLGDFLGRQNYSCGGPMYDISFANAF